MLICKFIDGVTREVQFIRLSAHVVKLVGVDIPENKSGFFVSREHQNDEWDYSRFTTVYNSGEGWVAYSDDGSVYIELDPFPELEPVLPAPTQLDIFEAQLAYTAMMTGTLLEV